MSDRDEFEAWALSEGWSTQDLDRLEGQYVYPVVKCMYEGWQAARRWRPISEAPKDGSLILVWLPGACSPDMAIWEEHGEWWDVVTLWPQGVGDDPTHWMPLPEPPNE